MLEPTDSAAGGSVPGLHIVTDDHVLARRSFLRTATEIVQAMDERAALHLRARRLPAHELYDLAESLIVAARTPIVINDRVDIAAAVGAEAVQLGARSLPIREARLVLGAGPAIGYSAHSPAEAADAQANGANFILLGTIYRSATHPELEPAGPELIAETAQRCTLPIIAIGGVTLEKVREVQAAGASGVAVIRAVWDAPDPVQAVRDFAKLV